VTDHIKPKIPKLFWVAAMAFLIWNAFGVMNYLTSVTYGVSDYLAAGYTAEQAEFMTGAPTWYIAFFAIAIWMGVAGAILFALKKSWAQKAYLISLVFIIINFAADAFLGSFKLLGTGYLIIMLVVLCLAIVEFWTARHYTMKGVLH